MTWLHAVLDVTPERRPDADAFWAAATGWPPGPPWPNHPELASLLPPHADPYFHVQTMTGSARFHLDVEVDDLVAERDRLVGAGAEQQEPQDQWQPMRSPGGLPFCLLPTRQHRAAEPTRWPGGHHSRLVQVCIDSPRDAHEAEAAFWRDALPTSRWSDGRSAEFAGKLHDDDGSPLQLLFQRLDEQAGPVRAHLDLGTDDLDAEVARLMRVGAGTLNPAPVSSDRGWVAMRDPLGLPFCVTTNSPAQTQHRDLD